MCFVFDPCESKLLHQHITILNTLTITILHYVFMLIKIISMWLEIQDNSARYTLYLSFLTSYALSFGYIALILILSPAPSSELALNRRGLALI